MENTKLEQILITLVEAQKDTNTKFDFLFSEIREVREENKEFRSEIREVREENKEFRSEIRDVREENKEFRSEIKQVREENRWLVVENKKLREEIRQLVLRNAEQAKEIANLNERVNFLTKCLNEANSKIAELTLENERLAQKVRTNEQLIQDLYTNYNHISPLLKSLIESSNSIVTDEDYQEIRNSEPLNEFRKASGIIRNRNHDPQQLIVKFGFKNFKGLCDSVAKPLSGLYQQLFGFKARVYRNSFVYWDNSETEQMVINQAYKTFMATCGYRVK